MYKYLEGLLRQERVTRQMIADELNIDISTVSEKLNNYNRLKLSEAKAIRDKFLPQYSLDFLYRTSDAQFQYINDARC